jgi:2,3-bisphosphoglycerate-independent phosphoglycerate mutase
MVRVLVILDGASEPLGEAPTSLERAHTPTLDGLAADGELLRLRTVARGLPAGSETAIPALLGWVPDAPVDRGAVEAAAQGVEVGDGERAWRVDRRDRADATDTARVLAERLPGHRVRHLAGHRMLAVGPRRPRTAAELLVWPTGMSPPRVLGEDTVVIGARGAAIGIARLMGARTIVPRGATGRPGTDLAAKAAAALRAIGGRDDGGLVVVHVGAPDEAAHERDADAKVAAIEAVDALLLAPLAEALRLRGGTLRVCPDHGCDPATGEHDGMPVPCLEWPPAPAPASSASASASASGACRREDARLTERAVAAAPVCALASGETAAPGGAVAA